MSIGRKGRKHSEETKLKMSLAHKGKIFSDDHKKNLSKAQKLRKRSPLSEETKRKISYSNRGKVVNQYTKNKLSLSLSGRTLSDEHKKRIGEGSTKSWQNPYSKLNSSAFREACSKLMSKQWDTGEFRNFMSALMISKRADVNSSYNTVECRAKRSESMRNRWADLGSAFNSAEFREKQRVFAVRMWSTPEIVKKIADGRRLKPNKHEIKVMSILDREFPSEWRYVGDFSLMIGTRNPDFVHSTKKLLIEYNGEFFHNQLYFPNVQSPEDRTRYFEEFGYNTLIIWQSELNNEDKLVDKIRRWLDE